MLIQQKSSIWKCPACQAELLLNNNVLRCENNHTYDVAKEGYVNLLLANQKRSKEPGDNKAMINARRAFLEQGYYQPLADELAALISQHQSNNHLQTQVNLFDAGCGEGYYLNRIKQTLKEILAAQQTGNDWSVNASGCDISKVAIQKAAKKYRDSHFAVASTFHLPVSDASQTALIQVFAPAGTEEIHRVLQPGGLWLQVNPAPNHLQQLKSQIYNTAEQHPVKPISASHFTVISDTTLTFDMTFHNSDDKMNLLMMTPFYWSASEQAKQRIQQSLSNVTCHFHIQVLQKS